MPILNTAYKRDEGRCWGPVFFPGETYAFYINFDEPIDAPNFGSLSLDLVDYITGQHVATDIGQLEQDMLLELPGLYNIKCQFTCPNVRFGWYRLAIMQGTSVVCISAPINVEEPNLVANTTYVAWRNKENKFGYQYENPGNENWYNKLRLQIIQRTYRIESDRKTYRNATNRRMRSLLNYSDYVIMAESYRFSEAGHLGIAAVYDHDTIFMNDVNVVPKDDYAVEDALQSVLCNATISLYIDGTTKPPVEAEMDTRFLSTNLLEELLANGEFIPVQ